MLIVSAVLGFACQPTDAPAGATAEAGIADVTLGEGAWGSTACAACTFTACNQERGDCRAEPGCARNLDCIEACPATAEGDPDPDCSARCPIAASTAAETARLALERCRVGGQATDCVTCPGAGRRRNHNPILTSTCENATYDAGPGATPVMEECSRCVGRRCCDARDACRTDESCFPLKDCYGACRDSACEDACFAQYDGSVGRLFGFLGCALVHCATACGSVENPCSACVYRNCADTYVACQADHDCYLLSHCLAPCGLSQGCVTACTAKFPGAVGLVESQTLCAQARCPLCR